MGRTTPSSFHVVHCYTPARWLWGNEYFRSSGVGHLAFRPARGRLRAMDLAAVARTALYVAISKP